MSVCAGCILRSDSFSRGTRIYWKDSSVPEQPGKRKWEGQRTCGSQSIFLRTQTIGSIGLLVPHSIIMPSWLRKWQNAALALLLHIINPEQEVSYFSHCNSISDLIILTMAPPAKYLCTNKKGTKQNCDLLINSALAKHSVSCLRFQSPLSAGKARNWRDRTESEPPPPLGMGFPVWFGVCMCVCVRACLPACLQINLDSWWLPGQPL